LWGWVGVGVVCGPGPRGGGGGGAQMDCIKKSLTLLEHTHRSVYRRMTSLCDDC